MYSVVISNDTINGCGPPSKFSFAFLNGGTPRRASSLGLLEAMSTLAQTRRAALVKGLGASNAADFSIKMDAVLTKDLGEINFLGRRAKAAFLVQGRETHRIIRITGRIGFTRPLVQSHNSGKVGGSGIRVKAWVIPVAGFPEELNKQMQSVSDQARAVVDCMHKSIPYLLSDVNSLELIKAELATDRSGVTICRGNGSV